MLVFYLVIVKIGSDEEEDLDYFVREAGEIIHLTESLPPAERSSRRLLQEMFRMIVKYKKLNQEPVSPPNFSNTHILPTGDMDDGMFENHGDNNSGFPSPSNKLVLDHLDKDPLLNNTNILPKLESKVSDLVLDQAEMKELTSNAEVLSFK